jgi:hypothetical protein
VVALIKCQCLCSMSPVPVILTTTTTVDEVKEQFLKVWRWRQLIEADKTFNLELYHDEERHHPLSIAGGGYFFVTWVVEGLAPTLYARVTSPLPLSSSASSPSSSPSFTAPAHPPSRAATAPSASRLSSRARRSLSRRSAAASPPPDQRIDSPPIFPISFKHGSHSLDDFNTHRFVQVAQLKRILEARERIPTQHQTLLYQGKVMEDDRTLVSYAVTEENANELHLIVGDRVKRSDEPSIVRVFVKTLTSKVLTYHISPNFTAAELKLLIQDDQGIHEDWQRLIFSGKQMEADKTVMSYYGVKADSTVHLVLRLTGC